MSTVTCAMTAPLLIAVIFPFSVLRALIFIVVSPLSRLRAARRTLRRVRAPSCHPAEKLSRRSSLLARAHMHVDPRNDPGALLPVVRVDECDHAGHRPPLVFEVDHFRT